MQDWKYLLGAMVAAYSLKLTKTRYDIICMVTEDVKRTSEFSILESCLLQLFSKIVEVPYLSCYVKSLFTNRQKELYSSWAESAFTKWNCLSFIEYEKILFLDADKIVLENIDHLFSLPAPAGTFSSPYSSNIVGKKGILDVYKNIKHGERVNEKMIEHGLNGINKIPSFTVRGTAVLLSPNLMHFTEFQKLLQTFTKENPFSYFSHSMTDEQMLVLFYHSFLPKEIGEHYNWTHIGIRYNWIAFVNKQWLPEEEKPPAIIHYFSGKPWNNQTEDWPDMQLWFDFVKIMLNDLSAKSDVRRLFPVIDSLKKTCFYCFIYNKSNYELHSFMDGKNINCPLYLNEKII